MRLLLFLMLIMYFKSELAVTPDWDGDTRDDIGKAIEQLKGL